MKLLASARGDEKKLADIVEGLKTEIQWVSAFCSLYNSKNSLPFQNLDELIAYYEEQISLINYVVQNRSSMLNDRWEQTFSEHHNLEPGALRNHIARIGSLLTNKIRGSQFGGLFLQNIQTQLTKCNASIDALKSMSPSYY